MSVKGGSNALRKLLRDTFGYDSFRPLQEQIIQDSLAGRDVFALLPTGGGKSLCYQLPALVRGGMTVVISPLIALMKDQVDALTTMGVRAACWHSALEGSAVSRLIQDLDAGQIQLLYVAPERLMAPGFREALGRWNPTAIAIDEAHCISEWGHDFRPEYRRISELRQEFPDLPLTALTATATPRVREDILTQLQLRDPSLYVASFNRPNLYYAVEEKIQPLERILRYIREHEEDAGIIYCHSRKGAEALADSLRSAGIRAGAYHAGMEAADRSRVQEAFLKDDLLVICATVAFGMGINKPNVRFVIHHDLPKNIESYYQETGRAGRDGLPGECLLLTGPGDRAKQLRFIDEKPDPAEREVALTQLDAMSRYAESLLCRRQTLLRYFGEDWPDTRCEGCDNCLNPKDTFDASIPFQKFASCIVRIHQHSGFPVGLAHVVDVLLGADTEKVRQWGHQELSTYGIGKELDRQQWRTLGRALIQLGWVHQNMERFQTLELSPAGRKALKDKTPLQLPKPAEAKTRPKIRSAAARAIHLNPAEESLFRALKALRKTLAEDRDVPPYIIFSDVALRHMASSKPTNLQAFAGIQGVGARKLEEFGPRFTEAIREHLET